MQRVSTKIEPNRDMEELKAKLIEQLGVDEAVADSAIEMVLSFVKDKLPSEAQGLIDTISKGDDPAGGAIDAIKGFFG